MDNSALAVIVPAGWVACLGRYVLQSYGEVDKVKVEVVNAPVSKLLPGNWLNLLVVVESLPELGDNVEILTLDKSLLDRASNTLTGLDLVSVVY